MNINYSTEHTIDISDNQELFCYKLFLKTSFIIFLSHTIILCFVPFRMRILRKKQSVPVIFIPP